MATVGRNAFDVSVTGKQGNGLQGDQRKGGGVRREDPAGLYSTFPISKRARTGLKAAGNQNARPQPCKLGGRNRGSFITKGKRDPIKGSRTPPKKEDKRESPDN